MEEPKWKKKVIVLFNNYYYYYLYMTNNKIIKNFKNIYLNITSRTLFFFCHFLSVI